MLTFTNSEDKQNQCFYLLGTAKPANSATHLISNSTSLIANVGSLLTGEAEDSCSFYSGPSDATILSFGEQAESCGSIAYEGAESCGSVAYSGGESFSASCAVSVSSSSGDCSGGGCSYSC